MRISTGTNMLPGTLVPLPAASRTNSEPTPTSLPDGSISAAPPQSAIGGNVKIALSVSYTHLAVYKRQLLDLSMVPTVAGAALGVSLGFRGFGSWWMNLLVLIGSVMALSLIHI